MFKFIANFVSAAMVFIYGNDIAHKALILTGKIIRLLFT